jgi:hypothetical protein
MSTFPNIIISMSNLHQILRFGLIQKLKYVAVIVILMLFANVTVFNMIFSFSH